MGEREGVRRSMWKRAGRTDTALEDFGCAQLCCKWWKNFVYLINWDKRESYTNKNEFFITLY